LNGESVYSAKESSKQEDVSDFLYEIREKNPFGRIIVIIDNFASHKSKKVTVTAKKLDIKNIFLPPYSPDLNPIEFI
jgi:putative transposase